MASPRRIFLLVFVLLSATACGNLDFQMRFASFVIMHQANHLFDLTSQQEKELKPEVQRFLKDVRREEFPKIADLLEDAETRLRTKGFSVAMVDESFRAGEKIFASILDRTEPSALQLARGGTTAQENAFAKTMKKESRSALDDVSTPAKSRKANRKRILKWTDNLMGSLTSTQDKDLDQFAIDHPYPVELQVKNKDHLIEEFLKTPKDKREAWIKQLFKDPETSWLPEYRKSRDAWRNDLKAYVSKFWTSLSEDQKKALFTGLRKKAADFRRLAKAD